MIRTVACALALAGCAGAEEGTAPADATFREVRDGILLRSCGFESCHGSGAGGLVLDEAGAYEALVDAPSAGAPGEILVVPGDPDASYLVWKIEGTDGIVGDRMPPGGQLPEDEIAEIRAWIAAGARND